MKKNIIIFLLFIAAAAVFLAVVIYKNSSNHSPGGGLSNATSNAIARQECEKDADCLVVGCSNQLCLPRGKASSTVSTCEWKDEYGCYSQDSCLCQNGQCQWAGSPQFVECLEQLD